MDLKTRPRILTSSDSYDESSGSSPCPNMGGSLALVTSNTMTDKNLNSDISSFIQSHASPRALETRSILTQTNAQSELTIQSQVSIPSQASLQSCFSLLSLQSNLGFPPSLARSSTDDKVKSFIVDYRCVATLKAQGGNICSLALSGEHLYSGSGTQNIRVWRKENLAEFSDFGSGDGAVKSLVVVGDRVFSAHQDHKIRVWKRSGQQPAHKHIATMPTLKDYMLTFIPPKNYGRIRRHHKKLWIQHIDKISVLTASTNDLLYSGSWDRTVKVWRLPDYKCVESFRAHDDAVNAVVVSHDGYVYTGSADTKIKVWVRQQGEKKHSLLRTMEAHKSAVNALALSADGLILYSGAGDRAIIVWEREDSAQHIGVAGALRGHRHAILCFACVGDILCSGSADKTIRVWRRNCGTIHSCVAVLEGHKAAVKCLAIAIEESTDYFVYSGSIDTDIKIWWVCGSNKNGKSERLIEQ